MARRWREDSNGSWHHVVNRGIARRPLFESRDDIRYFLSRLAREVRRGRLEVHSWCVLTTHFHLLVRSVSAELSEAMRRMQNEYSRSFNRRHARDGSLVRGRFFSRPVRTLAYRRTLVRYIDANPVRAGLAPRPDLYPWCSAWSFARAHGPPWLERSWIEEEVKEEARTPTYRPEDYFRAFPEAPTEALVRLVELRVARPVRPTDPDLLDDLIGAAPARVREWLQRKAELADGSVIGLPVCDGEGLARAEELLRARYGAWTVSPRGRSRDAWSIASIGLLRSLAGSSWSQIAGAVGASPSACYEIGVLHVELLRADPRYLERVAEMTSLVIELIHGSLPLGADSARRGAGSRSGSTVT
jgi:REP element-mobilizing transposase RayT